MRYFIVLDDLNNIVSFYSTNNFNSIIKNTVEVSVEDYKVLKLNPNYNYQYVNGVIINVGAKPIETEEQPLTDELQKLTAILDNVNLLVELQADTLGGVM